MTINSPQNQWFSLSFSYNISFLQLTLRPVPSYGNYSSRGSLTWIHLEVLTVWCCTFLTHLPSSMLKVICIIMEIEKLKQEAYNIGERNLWTYGLSNGFLCITYVWLGQMPGHSVFFLKTFWRVLLLITNQFLKITWHS